MVYVFMLQPVETPVRVWHKKLAYIFFSCGSSSYICLVYTYILGYSSNKPHLAAAATSKASSHHITLHQRRGCRAADRTVRSRPSPNKLHGRWCFPSALLTSQTLWGVGTMSSQLQPGQERERERARARAGLAAAASTCPFLADSCCQIRVSSAKSSQIGIMSVRDRSPIDGSLSTSMSAPQLMCFYLAVNLKSLD